MSIKLAIPEFRWPEFNKYSLYSGNVLRQLDVSRTRFHRSALYRHWSNQAYLERHSFLVDDLPELANQHLPTAIVMVPVMMMIVFIFFGQRIFGILMSFVGLILLLMALVISVLAPFISATLPAQALTKERESGRWELLMVLPRERMSVLWMRVATAIYAYRPLITMLEVMQSTLAILMILVVFVREQSATADSLILSYCLIFLIPAVFVMVWERRQDFVLSVLIGTNSGLFPGTKRVSTSAAAGIGYLIAGRVMTGLIAFIVASSSGNLEILIPVAVGGPGLLPLVGIPVEVALPVMFVYYGVRELIIDRLWSQTEQQISEYVYTG